jgi:hypothetical protein
VERWRRRDRRDGTRRPRARPRLHGAHRPLTAAHHRQRSLARASTGTSSRTARSTRTTTS